MSATATHARLRRGRTLAFLLALLVIVTSMTLNAAPAQAAGTPTVDITQVTAASQPSGSPFHYEVSYSCSVVASATCASDAVITIPLGAAASWPVALTPATTNYEVVGGELLIHLDDIAPGESGSIALTITPPNHTTPDGTTWSLTPTMSTTDAGTVTSAHTASSTATASATLSIVKNADAAVYSIGGTATFTMYVQCSQTSRGDLDFTTISVVDTLPAGLHYVSSSPSGTYDAATNTVTWDLNPRGAACDSSQLTSTQVLTLQATVGGQANDGVVNGSQLTNNAEVTGTTIGGGTATGSGSVALTAADTVGPGTSSKSGIGPFTNRVGDASVRDPNGTYYSGVTSGDSGSTFTVPATTSAGVLSGAAQRATGIDAAYRVQIDSRAGLSTFSMVDPVPCATNNPSGVIYQSNAFNGPLCQEPAFNPEFVNVTTSDLRFAGAGEGIPAAFIPEAVLLDGTRVPLVQVASSGTVVGPNGPGSLMFQVPTQYVGQVAALSFPAVTGMNSARTYIEIGGSVAAGFSGGDNIRNIAHIEYVSNLAPAGPVVGSANSAGNLYVVDQAVLSIRKNGQGSVDSIYWSVAATLSSPGPAVADVVITDLLPAGVHVAGGVGETNLTIYRPGTAITPQLFSVPLEVIDNYNGTGRTLLRWTVPAADVNQVLPATGGAVTMMPTLPNTAADFPGTYVNQAAVYYADAATNQSLCGEGAARTTDSVDLDGTANVFHCEDDVALTLAPTPGSASQLVTKQVKTDTNPTYTGYPNIGVISPDGGTATYRLEWTNKGALPLNNVTLYDLFPRAGDTGTLATTLNQSRNSSFQPILTSVGALPAGVSAYYSTSANPCRPEVLPDANNPGCVNDWSATPPADLATVLAMKFVSTQTYAYGASISIELNFTTPGVGANDVAWNTVAAGSTRATNGAALPPVESTKVGIARAGFAHLAVNKTVDQAEVSGGGQVTYTVTVLNDGQVDLVDVTAVDTLPPGMTFVAATGGGTESGGDVTWDIGDLPAGGSRSYTVTVTAPFPATATNYVNSFTLTGTDPETGGGAGVTPDNPCSADEAEVSSCATVLVNPVPALIISKSVDQTTALPGDTLTYTITVRNTSSFDVTQAAIYDALPDGVTYVSSDPEGMLIPVDAETELLAFFVDVAAGETITLTITATVNESAWGQTLENVALGDPSSPIETHYENSCTWEFAGGSLPASCAETVVPVQNAAVDVDKQVCLAALAVDCDPNDDSLWVDATDRPASGQAIFRIVARNAGNVALTDVVVDDPLPAGMAYLASSANASAGDVTGFVPTWAVGDLAVGEAQTLTFAVTLPDAETTLTNTAAISAPDPTDASSTLSDSDPAAVTTHAGHLTIAKVVDQTTATAGSELTYTLTVTNDGEFDLSDVIAADTLPAGVTFVSASDGGIEDAGVVTWTVGALAPGQTVTYTVVATVADTAIGSVLENRLSAVGTGPESDTPVPGVPTPETVCDDDPTQACATTVVPTPATHLTISKVVDDASARVGDELSYTVTVLNDGEADVTEITATDSLPAGVTFVSASDGGVDDAGAVTWSIDSLAAGESVSYTVVVRVDAASAGTTVENRLSASGTDPRTDLPVPGAPTPETVCTDAPTESCAVTSVVRPPMAEPTDEPTTAEPTDEPTTGEPTDEPTPGGTTAPPSVTPTGNADPTDAGPTDSDPANPGLPSTGADVSRVGLLGALLVVAGLALLIRRRRQAHQ